MDFGVLVKDWKEGGWVTSERSRYAGLRVSSQESMDWRVESRKRRAEQCK